MTTWTNNFEGGTNGVTVTTGNSGGVGNTPIDGIFGGGIAKYDNSVAHRGTLSCLVGPNANIGGAVHWLGGGAVTANLTTIYGRIYVYLTSYPPVFMRLYTGQDGSVNNYGLALGSAGLVHNRDVTTGVMRGSTSITALSLNTWHRIEWLLNVSNATNGQSATIKLFTDSNVEGTVPNETINSGNWTGSTAQINTHRLGAINTTATWQYNIDDIGLSNTAYLGSTGGGTTAVGESWGLLPL